MSGISTSPGWAFSILSTTTAAVATIGSSALPDPSPVSVSPGWTLRISPTRSPVRVWNVPAVTIIGWSRSIESSETTPAESTTVASTSLGVVGASFSRIASRATEGSDLVGFVNVSTIVSTAWRFSSTSAVSSSTAARSAFACPDESMAATWARPSL